MKCDTIFWTQPPALLDGASPLSIPTARRAVHAPAILRFASDSFMQDLLAMAETTPERLGEYRVRRETWRGFLPDPPHETPQPPPLALERLGIVRKRAPSGVNGSAPAAEMVPAGAPLKIYQPAHQRHYLVAASLVCGVTGLPDRGIEPGRGEQTVCVVRRLLPVAGAPESNDAEHAWVLTPKGYVWQSVGPDPERVIDGEERLPLFAINYPENGRRRRLFGAVIPVGKREAYLAAPQSNGGAGAGGGVTTRTARKVLFRKEVIEPWKNLVRQAAQVGKTFTVTPTGGDRLPTGPERKKRLRLERQKIQTVSWFILLDFAKYLAAYLKPVWRAVLDSSQRTRLNAAELALLSSLDTTQISAALRGTLARDSELNATGNELYASDDVLSSLTKALAQFGSPPEGVSTDLESRLENINSTYDRYDAASRALWPGFLFPLADPDQPSGAPLPPAPNLGGLAPEEQDELTLDGSSASDPMVLLDKLTVLALRALRDDDAPQPAVPAPAVAPANALEGRFVIRFAFQRPACEPLHCEVISDPTEAFLMAGFFDPDAPARPIRIGLPIDTSLAGLRKFDKNSGMVISDILCGQLGRLKGITLGDLVLSVLPWPFHKDLPGLDAAGAPCPTGMICSLSIPIVTICALILLVIMVTLFDAIFHWLPFFIHCFPVPGLKAKKN